MRRMNLDLQQETAVSAVPLAVHPVIPCRFTNFPHLPPTKAARCALTGTYGAPYVLRDSTPAGVQHLWEGTRPCVVGAQAGVRRPNCRIWSLA
jgi:hypothetical protein